MIRTNSKAVFLAAILMWPSLFVARQGWTQEEPAPPAQNETQAPEAAEPSIELDVEIDPGESTNTDADATDSDDEERSYVHRNAIVRFGADAHLAADESAETVVSIFGSSTSEGDVREGVVSVFGDTKVTGRAGDVVSVFGDTYVNSPIHGDVVAAFGNLELGPEAKIFGEAVAVGGTIRRHPDATVTRGIEEVSFGGDFVQLRWLRPWVEECLLLGRPLAPVAGINWAWWLAGGFLAFYMLLSLAFRQTIDRCVQTLESHPGESTLTALISVFLVPVVFILLCITVVGIILVPFFGLALFIAGLFGKTAVLAVIGRRITGFSTSGPFGHAAFAVLVGGIIITALYMVPVVGFIVFNLLGVLALGVIIYTILLSARARRTTEPALATAGGVPIETEPTVQAFDTSGATTSTEARLAPDLAVPANTLPRAEFLIRMGALLIDAILVGIIANMIPGSGDIWLLALAIYGALMWKLKGTTVGGIICNLRVVRLDGREIDWATSIVRALGCFLSLAAVLLGFIWIIFDPERQAWHDKIAGTVVVRVPKPGSLV